MLISIETRITCDFPGGGALRPINNLRTPPAEKSGSAHASVHSHILLLNLHVLLGCIVYLSLCRFNKSM